MKYYNVDKKEVNRNIILSDVVTATSVKAIIEDILDINFRDSEKEDEYKDYVRQPIKLYINSFGGSVYDGMALFDCIRNSKTPVFTIATGSAMSMGFILLLAGHRKFATKYATMMYHEASTFVWDKIEGIKQEVKETERLQDEILDKIVLKNTNITKEKLKEVRKLKQEWYISPSEAKKLKIIDEIL